MIAEITTVGYIERGVPLYIRQGRDGRDGQNTRWILMRRTRLVVLVANPSSGECSAQASHAAEASPKTKSSGIHPLHISRVLCDGQMMLAYHSGEQGDCLDVPDSRRHPDVSSISRQERTQWVFTGRTRPWRERERDR
jgi:hypothetical protein